MVSDSEGVLSAKLLLGQRPFQPAMRLHAVRFERSDSRAVGCADDWAGKTAECQGTADNLEAWTLSVTVDGETQIIEKGKAYHVYLDPEMAAAQGPSGAGGAQAPSGKGIAAEGGAQPIPDRGGSSDGNRDILCGVGSNGQCRPAIVGRKHEKN